MSTENSAKRVGKEPPPRQRQRQPSVAARAARVSTEELAEALAALEMRDRDLEGVVSIGEAVERLGITGATPEEIWAQVRAQRQRRESRPKFTEPAAAAAGPPRRRLRALPGRRGTAAAGVAAAAVVATWWWGPGARRETPAPRELPAPATAPAPVAGAAGTLRTLAEVPDGRFVECDHEGLERLLRGGRRVDPSKLIVRDLRAVRAQGSWLLVKHGGGEVYVHGYVAPMSPAAAEALGTIRVYSGRLDDTRAGGFAYLEPITLRIGRRDRSGRRDRRRGIAAGGFRFHGGAAAAAGGPSSILVSDVRPDEHAKERPEPWQD